jgi:hypothetical protein
MLGHVGSGSRALGIINVGTREKWVISLTPRPLYFREDALCTHWITGDWMGSSAGLDAGVAKKKCLPPSGDETPVVQPVGSHYTD